MRLLLTLFIAARAFSKELFGGVTTCIIGCLSSWSHPVSNADVQSINAISSVSNLILTPSYSKAHNYLDTRLTVGAGLPSPYERKCGVDTIECQFIFGFYYKQTVTRNGSSF